MKKEQENLVRIEEVSKRAGLSVPFIRKLMRKESLPYYKIGYSIRFNMVEVDRWLSQHRAKSA